MAVTAMMRPFLRPDTVASAKRVASVPWSRAGMTTTMTATAMSAMPIERLAAVNATPSLPQEQDDGPQRQRMRAASYQYTAPETEYHVYPRFPTSHVTASGRRTLINDFRFNDPSQLVSLVRGCLYVGLNTTAHVDVPEQRADTSVTDRQDTMMSAGTSTRW